MTNSQREKIEALATKKAVQSTIEIFDDPDAPNKEPFTVSEIKSGLIQIAEFALTLATEPVGDAVDSFKLAQNLKQNNCPGVSFPVIHMIVRSSRKGMVPKSAVEDAVRSEKNRIIELIISHYNNTEYESVMQGLVMILNTTNQGEKE